MGLSSDKAASLDKARLLFPAASLDRKKDHNRAESLLLAEYGRRTAHQLRVVTVKAGKEAA
jgi:hypothetical protein